MARILDPLRFLVCAGALLLGRGEAGAEIPARFQHAFQQTAVIELEDTLDSLLALRDFRVMPTGGFATTDYYEQGVRLYHPQGTLERVIPGGRDGNPHSQTTRIALDESHIFATCLDTDKLTVLDLEGRRLGSFRPRGFTPNEIQVDGTGHLYLGGRSSVATEPTYGFALHKFSPEFAYQGSWFRRASESETLAGPVIAFFGFDIDPAGDLVAVQPLHNGVFKFAPSGDLVDSTAWSPGRSPFFQPPSPYTGSPSPRAQQGWFQSWTQVLDIFAGPRYLYLVLQTHQPSKFVVHVLDADLERVTPGIPTDYRLLEVDTQGRLYFLLSDTPDRIGVYRFVVGEGFE